MREQAEKGTARKLVGMVLEGRRSARQGMGIRANGKDVGLVTSACLSPTLEKAIAMGYVDAALADNGTALEVVAGERTIAAEVVPLPFYKKK